MWIQHLLGLSSMSIRWPGRSLGSHAWILIAMLQLAVDFPSCESLGPGPEFRLLPRPPQRPPRLWSLRSGQPSRLPAPVWSPRAPRAERAHGQMPRARRAHRPRDQVASLVPRGGLAKPPAAAKSSPSLTSSSSSSSSAVAGGAPEHQSLLRRGKRHVQDTGLSGFDFRGSRPTTETEFIAWGPTGDEEAPEANTFPGVFGPTTVPILQTRKTTVATTTIAAIMATSISLQTEGVTASPDPRRRIPAGASTTEPSPRPSNNGKDSKPPRILGETSGYGLRCHRAIITICRLIGIKDMYAKVSGSVNMLNLTRGLFHGLSRQETHQQLADKKGLHVVEFREECGPLPILVASPRGALRKDPEPEEEVPDIRLDWEEVKAAQGMKRSIWSGLKRAST
ncbi:adherens junction-associated protein 1-like isoform X1 [Ictidomys tridecemlineatus]